MALTLASPFLHLALSSTSSYQSSSLSPQFRENFNSQPSSLRSPRISTWILGCFLSSSIPRPPSTFKNPLSSPLNPGFCSFFSSFYYMYPYYFVSFSGSSSPTSSSPSFQRPLFHFNLSSSRSLLFPALVFISGHLLHLLIRVFVFGIEFLS